MRSTATILRPSASAANGPPGDSANYASYQAIAAPGEPPSSTGSVIQYNPDDRSNAFDASGAMIAQPPQVILGHEMTHALAK
ncbi:M91 family zinc metallopeptidase [Sorangium sp. So ce124]|uniref:M91 family zinc metallopeptidase n=1 Tax=Sorangium sp. So ce124 TaxID=3133280 RepID=UPI003F5E65E4